MEKLLSGRQKKGYLASCEKRSFVERLRKEKFFSSSHLMGFTYKRYPCMFLDDRLRSMFF